MRDIKRIISVLLIVCIIVSAAGCNARQNVAVRPLCESFFNDVKEGNPSKLMSYFDSSDDTTIEDLNSVIRPSGLNDAQYAYLDAIKKTTAFTVQDPVFDIEYKTKGSPCNIIILTTYKSFMNLLFLIFLTGIKYTFILSKRHLG